MKKNYHKIIAASLIGALVFSATAAGCTQNSNQGESSSGSSVGESSSPAGDASAAEPSDSSSEDFQQSGDTEQEEDNSTIPEISDPTPDNEGEMVDGIFIYNDVAYELFYGSEGMAKYYAETISELKKGLGDSIKVYNVMVPTHVGVDLPDKFSDLCSSQKDYLDTIMNSYTEDIVGVNTYQTMLRHRDEYLYFNTDHHWTGLAAYYAYQDFAKAAGVEPVKLSELHEGVIEGYQGSLARDTGLESLKEDHVVYYTSDSDIDCTLYEDDGTGGQDWMLIHSYAEGVNAYGVFLGGDNALLVAKNPDGNGKKVAVVKESYGNAFCPYIAYTYSETHMIDFRYFELDLKDYLEENGIDEVIFINNSMASATDARCEELAGLIHS